MGPNYVRPSVDRTLIEIYYFVTTLHLGFASPTIVRDCILDLKHHVLGRGLFYSISSSNGLWNSIVTELLVEPVGFSTNLNVVHFLVWGIMRNLFECKVF